MPKPTDNQFTTEMKELLARTSKDYRRGISLSFRGNASSDRLWEIFFGLNLCMCLAVGIVCLLSPEDKGGAIVMLVCACLLLWLTRYAHNDRKDWLELAEFCEEESDAEAD